MRFLCIDHITGEQKLQPLGPADVPDEPLGTPKTRDDPQVDLGLPKTSVFSRYPQMAGHGQLATSAQRKTVDCCDNGPGKTLDEEKHLLAVLGHPATGLGVQIEKFLNIGACHKGLAAGSRQDDPPERIAPGCIFTKKVLQLPHGLLIEGIQGLFPLDGKQQYAAFFFDLQVVVGHACGFGLKIGNPQAVSGCRPARGGFLVQHLYLVVDGLLMDGLEEHTQEGAAQSQVLALGEGLLQDRQVSIPFKGSDLAADPHAAADTFGNNSIFNAGVKNPSMRPLLLLGIVLWAFHTAAAQDAPSNIYLFQLTVSEDSVYALSRPRYLTGFNPRGYNHHPSFLSRDELCLSVRTPNSRQADLYKLDLRDTTITRLTKTPEGEYFPQPTPSAYNFSALRLELQMRDTLSRLWEFPIDGVTDGRPIFKYADDIQAYHWINSQRVAVYRQGKPPKLVIMDVNSDRELAQVGQPGAPVGTCFKMQPNGKLLFLQKKPVGPAELREFQLRDGTDQLLTEALPGAEQFELLPNGAILMGQGSRIYLYDRFRGGGWREIADLSYYNIRSISRLALSRDLKLAVVSRP